SLLANVKRSRHSTVREDLGVAEKDYSVLTLHRPSNVDDPAGFARILDALEQIGKRIPIIFPAHPRTRKMIAELDLAARIDQMKSLRVIEPLGYLDFLQLFSGARFVLTDSG